MYAVRQTMARNNGWGLYHLVASGVTSWFEYASVLVELALEKKLISRRLNLNAVSTGDLAQVAKRPRNSRLCNKNFSDVFGFPLPDWRIGVEQFERQLAGQKTNL